MRSEEPWDLISLLEMLHLWISPLTTMVALIVSVTALVGFVTGLEVRHRLVFVVTAALGAVLAFGLYILSGSLLLSNAEYLQYMWFQQAWWWLWLGAAGGLAGTLAQRCFLPE